MMKKLISLVLCAVLLFSCMTFAQAETQQESTTAVDIVLLIDNSGSNFNQAQNDPVGYRLDAAQMAIALLGQNNGSRVAFVPFAAQVYHEATGFDEISSMNDYLTNMGNCEELREYKHHDENTGGTDYAQAMAYAYNLLARRGPDENNQPLIILLTDGGLKTEITLSNNQKQRYVSKVYYVWNEQTGVYDETAGNVKVSVNRSWYAGTAREQEQNLVYYAEELRDHVVQQCSDMGYPIYTVALKDNEDKHNTHYSELERIAEDTGARMQRVEDNLQGLPAFFSEILGERIGSTRMDPLHPVFNNQTGRWEVKFMVPNLSVMEANLFVPLDGIVDDSIRLEAPRGGNHTRDVQSLSTPNFVLYKLRNPQEIGEWILSFEASEEAARQISFNLLYNYDVVLRGSVAKENAPNAASEFQRSDVLVFSGKFFDEGEGMDSEDVNLYRTSVGNGFEMRATYKLYRVVNGIEEATPVYSGNMDFNEHQTPLRYTARLDMKNTPPTNGYNTLPAGDYVMKLHVEGCGMERDAQIEFKLNNTAPTYAGRTITKAHEVDETPGDHEKIWNLGEYIKDEDNDRLTTRFVADGIVDPVADLEYNPNTMELKSIARDADGDGKHDSGTVTGKLIIEEADWGFTTEIPVVVNLQSMSNALAQENIPNISVADKATGTELTKNADGKYALAKNTTYEIKVKLLRRDGTVNRTDAEQLNVKVAISGDYNTVVATEMSMSADNKGVFTFEYTTGSKLGEWDIHADVYQTSLAASPLRSDDVKAIVENHEPTLRYVEEDKLEYTIYHNPLPEFLSFLGKETPEEERSINLTEFFEDTDNETLAYKLDSAPSIHLLTIVGEATDSIWVMHPVEGANSSTEFIVYAYDNDNEQTDPIVFKVRLVDLVRVWTERGLIALAALIVLIILILIIRQIRKPKFPRGAVLGVREGNSDYDTNTYEFVPSKKPISLAAVVMADTAAKFGITANALTNIELVPVRSANYSIGVRLKKRMDDVMVGLSSKSIGKGKKPTVWVPGDALILNSRNNTTGSELNVVLDPPEIPIGPTPGPDPDPFQVNDINGFGGFNSDVDVFGANDVSGSYGGMTAEDFNTASAPVDTGFSMPVGDDNNVVDTYASEDTPTDTFTIDGF